MRKVVQFLLWTAIVLGAIVAVLRYTAIRWWRVPDNDPYLEASIAPTLRGGDLIILWRLTKPSFGDLVLCPEPGAPERVVIGRFAGESRDQIVFDESSLTINRTSVGTERGCPAFTVTDPNSGRDVEQNCDVEVLAGRGHMRGEWSGHKKGGKPVEKKVPEGKIFLVSDNRLYPYDSRDFGPVDPATCQETVVFRLVSRAGFFDEENRFMFIP